jgi:hypothetical protein
MKKLSLVGKEQKLPTVSDLPVRQPKHDVVFFDKNLECEVMASPCGYDLLWLANVTIKLPFSNEERPHREVVRHIHIHPKKWWKFIFRTPESELRKEIKAFKKEVQEIHDNHSALGAMKL